MGRCLKFLITTSSIFLILQIQKKWIPVLWKNQNQNQRIVGSGCFRHLKELVILFEKEPAGISPVILMPQNSWEPGLCMKTEDMICKNHDFQVARTGLITSKGVLSAPVSNNRHHCEKNLIRVSMSTVQKVTPLKQACSLAPDKWPGHSTFCLKDILMSSRVSL